MDGFIKQNLRSGGALVLDDATSSGLSGESVGDGGQRVCAREAAERSTTTHRLSLGREHQQP